jgi:phage portal protein BeeE
MARSQRAAAGGGREVALNPGSFTAPYTVGMTFGNTGKGADWFGPGQPMAPQAPEEVKGRAFDFPNGYNIINQTRAYEPISFATLRAFADAYDLLRLIIETRKDAMERLRWVIQLRDSKEKMTAQKRNKIKELTKFFLKPDGDHSWNAWLRMILEDLFVVDAVSLHRRKTRGGKLIALDQIDGATVRRVLDDWGRTPEHPDDTAYQQILKGMPAVNYRASELLYRPRNLRVHKVYGYSPVEQLLMTINIGLRRQIFQLNFFTEGNMPSALIGVPEQWTPDQIRTFQEWFDNLLAGNLGERRKARFVPSAVGKTYIPTQETELFGKAEEWLARVTCFAFSLSPQPFLQMMNRATSDTAAQEAASTGLAPIQNWIKDLIDTVLAEDLDAADFEFTWRGDDELDPTKRQQITSGYLKDGLLSMNEARQDMGREPYDDPMFDQPMFMTSNGLAPLTLTAQAQGGEKLDENGDPINSPDPGEQGSQQQDDGDEEKKEDKAGVVKTLESLVAAGDQEQLAAFLRTMNEGATA